MTLARERGGEMAGCGPILLKGSTGRTDDFCAADVPVLRRLTNGTRCLSSAWPRMFAAWNTS